MHLKSYEEHLMQYPEFRIHKHLMLYVPPILLTLGIIGNIVSYVILRRKSMRRISTYFYLAVLSLADILVLCIGLLTIWIDELMGFNPVDRSDWLCKITKAVGYTVSDFSVWCIIAVTVERYIVVRYPLRAGTLCNTKRAMVFILVVFVFLLAVNSHFFWTVNVYSMVISNRSNDSNSTSIHLTVCGSEKYPFLVNTVWSWVDAFLYSFLPFVVIIVLNSLIISIVYTAQKGRTQLQVGGARESRRHNSVTSIKLTFMLLCVSFAFLITTLPMNITSIAAFFFGASKNNLASMSKYKLAYSVTQLLMYTNHSMNFFLYCATGQKFRQELLRIFCRSKTLPYVTTDIKSGMKESCHRCDITNGATSITELKTYVKYSPVSH